MEQPVSTGAKDGQAPLPIGNLVFKLVTNLFLLLLLVLLGGVLGAMVFYVRWDEFVASILDPESLFALKLTAICVTASTALCLVVGIPVAYALSRQQVPLGIVVDTIIDLPLVLPQLIAGIALLMFFQTSLGVWIETHIMGFVYRIPGIVLAIFFPTVSLAVRSMKAAFDGVDRRYEQVARTLGCTETQAFWKVSLPLARTGLVAGTVLTWAYSLGAFGSILMFAGATRYKTTVVPIAIFLNMTTGKITAGLSLTIVLLALAVISLFAFKRLGGRATIA